MRNLFFITALIAGTLALFTSCGGQKQVIVTQQQSSAPFQETHAMPCEAYDTPEEFAATGIYRGSSYQKGALQIYALRIAKRIIYEKYHHSYLGLLSNYDNSTGNNRGNDIQDKMTAAGDQVVEAILNDLQANCIRFSNIFDDGTCECYVSVIVPKTIIAEQVSKRVNDVLTEEEKLAISFDEFNYRKLMEEKLRDYKENKN